MLSNEKRRKVGKAILRHLTTNSYTYLQLIAALIVKDYLSAYIILKKLLLKTAFQFAITKVRTIKERRDEKNRR